MNIVTQGKKVRLDPIDFLAAGGQAEIYRKQDLVYKIYSAGLPDLKKVLELSVLDDPDLIRPIDSVEDGKGKVIGYTFRFVDGKPVCRVFPKSFRDRNGIGPGEALAMYRSLKRLVEATHSKGLLVVDLNELNYLVGDDFERLYGIDVDSYQTPSYPAGFLMPSVRDWTAKQWTEGSDWFSFAVVSFQLFRGIHPYRGRHPQLGDDLEKRMRAGVSVLNQEVKYPHGATLPESVVPKRLQGWYRSVLESGERSAPPDVDAIAPVAPLVLKATVESDLFVITPIHRYLGPVTQYRSVGQDQVVQAGTEVYLRDFWSSACHGTVGIISGSPCQAWIEQGSLRVELIRASWLKCEIEATGVITVDGQIWAVTLNDVLKFNRVGDRIVAQVVCSVVGRSAQTFDGVVVQSALGSVFVLGCRSGAMFVRVPELDTYKVVDGIQRSGVVVLLAEQKGRYDRIVIRTDGPSHDIRIVEDVGSWSVNLAVLPKGVAALVDHEGRVELFSSKVGSHGARVVEDKGVAAGDLLFARGDEMLLVSGGNVSTIRFKELK